MAAVLVTAAADLAGRGPRVAVVTRGVLVVLIGAAPGVCVVTSCRGRMPPLCATTS